MKLRRVERLLIVKRCMIKAFAFACAYSVEGEILLPFHSLIHSCIVCCQKMGGKGWVFRGLMYSRRVS